MVSFVDVEGFSFAKVNVHLGTETGPRLVVDRGFLRVQVLHKEDDNDSNNATDPQYRLVVALHTNDGSQGLDSLFVSFDNFVAIANKAVRSPNGAVRKGKITIDVASPVSCGTLSSTSIVIKMDLEDAILLYSNVYRA